MAVKKSPILKVESIYKRFGGFAALSDVSLEVAPGEVVAIIGPSGSGKSTLLRCINQLEPQTTGRIVVGSISIDGGAAVTQARLRSLRKSVGMVFQSFNLFPHLTVIDNICLAQRRVLGRSQEESEEVAMRLLERVGLRDKARDYPDRCSGGQQQRVAIARALALEPQIMLFDEPTSSLDPELGIEVLQVMRELAEKGMTMLVVTHEMHFAEDVSSRTLIMADGRIIEDGRSVDVMRKPQTTRAQKFLSAVRDR
ncbi:amino acid ABC transporter ATP-binding protein [Pelagibacterium sediminicola]|uniref:amino acid ABC transporter ATP-binding protein n=1 Tax=Pelagibacterium sediminicola TaxID=2248761 RepID=UPI000E31B7E8|nr:amino acid ABC transporter ATP-binding protein [Pelagibacterium sediminicola]